MLSLSFINGEFGPIKFLKPRTQEIDVDITFSIMRTNLKDDIIEKVEDNIKNDAEWIPENPDFNPYDLGKKTKKSHQVL